MENRSVREAPKRWVAGAFLSLMMIFTGTILLIMQTGSFDYNEGIIVKSSGDIFVVLSRIALILGGVIILIKRKMGNYFAIGIYALTLGISRLLRSIPYLVSENDITFYSNFILIIIGINLIVGGYNHLTVRTRNPVVMRYTTLGIVIGYVLLHIFIIYKQYDPALLYEYAADSMLYLPLYVALLFVLFSKEVVNNAPMGRIKRLSAITAQRFSVGECVSVSMEDGQKIIDGFSSPSWKEETVGGIVKREEQVTFHTKIGDRDVILNRWEDDPALYITVIDDHTDSFITGHRIRADSYVQDNETIELIDEKGICASIRMEAME